MKLDTAPLPSRRDFKSIGPKYLAAGLKFEAFFKISTKSIVQNRHSRAIACRRNSSNVNAHSTYHVNGSKSASLSAIGKIITITEYTQTLMMQERLAKGCF